MLTDSEIKSLNGLSPEQVKRSLAEHGYNELPSSHKNTIWSIAFGVVREPMFLLLVACGILYLLLGDLQEALMLLGFVFLMIGITIYQEGKTERALEALKDLSSPRALVIRDGQRIRIAGREVVPGDLMILTEGDRVAADGILLWCLNLSVDESMLTGESLSVQKNAVSEPTQAKDMVRPGGEGIPCIYSGSLVVQGQGIALVKATGLLTEMGKIGRALQSVAAEETPLQKETSSLVKTIFLISALLCLTVTVASAMRESLIDSILKGVTLAMAMLPEEFPVVLTIFLALGAWRMSRKNMLARKMAAVETLGASTVLCVDKTGTLTQNRMSIQSLYANETLWHVDHSLELAETFHELIEYGILASKKDPFDPMEKALQKIGTERLEKTEHLHNDWKLVHEYPLSRSLLALSQVWNSPNGRDYVVASKGAPEAIMELCHLTTAEQKRVTDKIETMAHAGLRVLGVAKAHFQSEAALPLQQHDFQFEFVGLLGLSDPIRPEVPSAIKECYSAGIRVVMITGDYPQTAQNIALQIGLDGREHVITGLELGSLSESELQKKIKYTNIFARVVPEQKLLLVNALKANGEIVGMTGDGVNDAPALKSANIGISMGGRGTDVAREASDLVLLDDNFSTIVAAVKMGRRIFDNLKKAMAYIVSVHIPIAGMSLLPVLLRWEDTILFPVHIVFLELIIDPACSVVFEAEEAEPDIMHRRPRPAREPLFGKRTLILSILQGLISLSVVAAVFRISIAHGNTIEQSRTLSFITLIISNLSLILTNRSWSRMIWTNIKVKNSALRYVLAGALGSLGLIVSVPILRRLFHFAATPGEDMLIAIGMGVASIIWFELLKLFSLRHHQDLLLDTAASSKEDSRDA